MMFRPFPRRRRHGAALAAALFLWAAAAHVAPPPPVAAAQQQRRPRTPGAAKPARGNDAAGLSPATARAVEALIAGEMRRQRIPGLSAAVVTGNRLRWTKGFGLADLENRVPATPGTVYRFGSIAKPVTAAAIMRLVQAGRIDLDAPIRRYVPEFPEKPWPVTVRQVLCHQAGIRGYANDEFTSTRHYTRLADTLAVFANDPLLHEPGTRYAYSTYGYNLLGRALETVTGRPYAAAVRDGVFRPAGMATARTDDVRAIIPRRAAGYRRNAAGRLENAELTDTSNKVPGGGLCGSALDLARFAIALQTDVLLRPETRARMWTRQATRDGALTEYALGWRVGERDGRREVHHGGAQQRVRAFLYLLPDENVAVVLMCNSENATLSPLARRVADLVRPAGGKK